MKESNEEMDTILLDMHNTLDELEKHVSYMSSFLSEEKVSIDLAQVCVELALLLDIQSC